MVLNEFGLLPEEDTDHAYKEVLLPRFQDPAFGSYDHLSKLQ